MVEVVFVLGGCKHLVPPQYGQKHVSVRSRQIPFTSHEEAITERHTEQCMIFSTDIYFLLFMFLI